MASARANRSFAPGAAASLGLLLAPVKAVPHNTPPQNTPDHNTLHCRHRRGAGPRLVWPRNRNRNHPMTAAPRTVLCYGDSNTHGTAPMAHAADSRRFDRDTRWPARLARHLGPGWLVLEEGLPGRTTLHDDPIEGAHRNGASVLPAVLFSHAPVDAVVLMLGTNDLKQRFSVTAFDIAASIGKLADAIAGSGCGPDGAAPKLLIVAPAPIIETGWLAGMFEGGAAKGRRLAALYQTVAAERGAGFLDAGAVASVDPHEGVHLPPAAHAALAEAVATALLRIA